LGPTAAGAAAKHLSAVGQVYAAAAQAMREGDERGE